MLDFALVDGRGTKQKTGVGTNGEICVAQHLYPAQTETDEVELFREYLENSGSNDMLVDGSSTPVTFSIDAHSTQDIYIKSVSFVISDAGAALNEFGNLSALSNGCKFFYEAQAGEIVIGDSLTTNWTMIRMCGGKPAFGDAATVFRANNVSGNSEGYIPFFDFADFGMPWGIRLRAGSNQRLGFVINDNVSALDELNAIANGFRLRNGSTL